MFQHVDLEDVQITCSTGQTVDEPYTTENLANINGGYKILTNIAELLRVSFCNLCVSDDFWAYFNIVQALHTFVPLLLLLNYVVLRALWKIDVHLISTLVNRSLYYIIIIIIIIIIIPLCAIMPDLFKKYV